MNRVKCGSKCGCGVRYATQLNVYASFVRSASKIFMFGLLVSCQARTMGQLAALSIAGMHDVVDGSMFFELFTHVSRFFGFKVTLLGAFNGQNFPHSDEVRLCSCDPYLTHVCVMRPIL